MKIKIVTDSTADLPRLLAVDLGIEVVPSYVVFGSHVLRDRVEISEDEFYRKLNQESLLPETRPPTPQDFKLAYQKAARDAEAIISIHISGKLSATVNSAQRGKELLDKDIAIEVIDSQMATMGTGLLTIQAAALATQATDSAALAREVRDHIAYIHLEGYLDSLKYLERSGRLGRARALLGSLLRVKPVLTMKDGELEPVARVRNQFSGMSRLYEFVEHARHIEDLAIIYGKTPEAAQLLADNLNNVFPKERIRLSRLGPVLGVHCGPEILFVALRTRKAIKQPA